MGPPQFRWLGLRVIFPAMVLTAIFDQQTSSTVLLFIGQVMSPLSTLAAGSIVLLTFRHARWPLMIVGMTLGLRAVRAVAGTNEALVALYTIVLGLVFCTAGAVVAIQRPRLIYKQVLWVCLLNFPVMLLQIIGVGEWTQIMRTDIADVVRDVTQFPTLFVPSEDVIVTVLQARPAGVFPSNILFAVILVIALALHYARPEQRNVTWRDVMLCSVVVLAMAKVVFLMFIVIMTWSMVFGDSGRRRRAVCALALYAAMLGLHAALFPGIFAYTTSWELIALNVTIRLADFMLSTGIGSLRELANDLPEKVLRVADDPLTRQSGYASLAKVLPYLFVGACVVAPMMMKNLRRLRREGREQADAATLCLFAILVIPVITSFVEAPIYAFFAGFAMLPLLLVAEPRYRILFVSSDGTSPKDGRIGAQGGPRSERKS